MKRIIVSASAGFVIIYIDSCSLRQIDMLPSPSVPKVPFHIPHFRLHCKPQPLFGRDCSLRPFGVLIKDVRFHFDAPLFPIFPLTRGEGEKGTENWGRQTTTAYRSGTRISPSFFFFQWRNGFVGHRTSPPIFPSCLLGLRENSMNHIILFVDLTLRSSKKMLR